MKNGWVSIHRRILNKGYYKQSQYIHLWVHLLLKANHEPNEWLYKNKIMKVNRGQLITSRKTLAEETGIQVSKIERILKCFESEQQIEQQNLFTSRLITITNYDDYQKSEQQNEHRVNSKRTASEQQVNTNNNDNNDNNKNSSEKFDENSFCPEVELLYELFTLTFVGTEKRYIPKNKKAVQSWKSEIEKCIRIDDYKPWMIADVIDYFRQDEFWKTNFYSPLKLRKKKEGASYIDRFWSKYNAEAGDVVEPKMPEIEYLQELIEKWSNHAT